MNYSINSKKKLIEQLFTEILWDGDKGYVECPGKHLHTTADGHKDCAVFLNRNKIPQVTCFHKSCKDIVASKNEDIKQAFLTECDTKNKCRHLPPIPDDPDAQFRMLLANCFEPDEVVSIVPGGEDGKPHSSGCNGKTRDEWLANLESKSLSDLFPGRNGLFIRMNPVKANSKARDQDVVSFRFTLIESDEGTKIQQEKSLRESGLPIAALIDSGSKSIHAWVRVDAKDHDEFKARRLEITKKLPKSYKFDDSVKNPARLSRCPGAMRGKSAQRLLALNIGPRSFSDWEIEAKGGDLKSYSVNDLLRFDPKSDSTNLLGNRWICKGYCLLITAPTGVGKSSLTAQLAICWALNESGLGIMPSKPLKSLIIQAENDQGDLAEMFQGVVSGLKLDKEKISVLQDRIKLIDGSCLNQADFTTFLKNLVVKHKPDLCWIDPLLSFVGSDILNIDAMYQLLAKDLKEISNQTGVAWILIHHTGKQNEPGGKNGALDPAYMGIGSSVLSNIAREIVSIKPDKKGSYIFHPCKRKRRAGLTNTSGTRVDFIKIRHSLNSVFWEITPELPSSREGKCKSGRKRSVTEITEFHGLQSLSGGTAAELARKYNVSEVTIRRRFREFKSEHNH
jgi:RecA-family ATPase